MSHICIDHANATESQRLSLCVHVCVSNHRTKITSGDILFSARMIEGDCTLLDTTQNSNKGK